LDYWNVFFSICGNVSQNLIEVVMDEQTRNLVKKLIQFGKTSEGIKLIAKLSLLDSCINSVADYQDPTLQAMEVVKVAQVYDRREYTNRQIALLESTLQFMSKQKP
jgi:hypothetical protein